MSEIADFATLVLIVAGGFSVAVISTRLTERVPVPAPALFLVAAAVVSDLWPELDEHLPVRTIERIAVVALIVILFNGGIDITMRRLRASIVPILSLGLVGTFLTAGGIAAVAHWVLGMDWILAGLIGAALAPTDPAVMFSVLGRREVAGRSGTTLEGEAGMNDPAGIALMIGMIELATHDDATVLVVGREFVVEMVVGAAFGLLGGRLLVPLLRRARLPSGSMYPILALTLAGALYGATSIAHGSGFLAVFLAGLLIGDARLPYKTEIERFQSSLAGLAELVVFVALGATVHLTRAHRPRLGRGSRPGRDAGRGDPAPGRGDHADGRAHEQEREGVHRVRRAEGRRAGPARGVRDPRRRAGRRSASTTWSSSQCSCPSSRRARSCPLWRAGWASGCTCETGCRGSCRCASAASRRGRTSSASRRARTPMARRWATCRWATTPG